MIVACENVEPAWLCCTASDRKSLVIVATGEVLPGGNFNAEPVAFAADQIAVAISEIGAIEPPLDEAISPSLVHSNTRHLKHPMFVCALFVLRSIRHSSYRFDLMREACLGPG